MSGTPRPGIEQLGTSEMSFADLVDVLLEGVWAADHDGVTAFASPRMADILATSLDQMLGTPLVDWFHEQDRQLARDMWRRRTQGLTDTYEARMRRADGEIIHVRLHVSPLFDNGVIVGSVAAVTDITQLHQAADEKEQALQAAQEANEAKTTFLSWVSHEVRTPLNTIAGFAQLLQVGLERESDRRMIADILAATAHINGLVQDLLDYSRAEAHGLDSSLGAVDLNDAVKEAMSLVIGTARDHDVRIIDHVGYHTVIADRRPLVQVLTNLLTNAVKYGGDGSDVTVASELVGRCVRCTVTDQGPGISPHQQLVIFNPFQRLENARGVAGVGLGLAIADAYVRAMHGTISINSELGYGSTFVVELPVATLEAPEAAPTTRLVLYVEDEPLNASLVSSIVALLPGRTFHVAPTVAAGIEAALQLSPSLVLLDLNLPDGSGFEVLKAIRADSALRNTPVFMLSADATGQAIGMATDLGADRFITKPFDLGEFLEVIGAATTTPTTPTTPSAQSAAIRRNR